MLQILTERRRSCRICADRDPGCIRNGAEFSFDPAVFSYWSQWMGHTSPKMLIVGQDFGDVGYFNLNKGRDEPENTTNNNLHRLLAHAGVHVGRPPTLDASASIFLTNSILCLKTGSMSDPIKDRWVKACSDKHLAPLIDCLRPRIIVGMGSSGWLAARTALRLVEVPEKIGIAAGGRFLTTSGVQVFPVGHCSGLGIRNRPWAQQLDDWKSIGIAFQAAS